MRRLFPLFLGLVASAWATGCCHSYHSRCVDWDDGCYAGGGDHCRPRHHRNRRNRRCDNNMCAPADCYDPCCGSADGAAYGMPEGGMPMGGAYDTGAMMGTPGCAGCAGGTLAPVPGTSGGVTSYNGLPMDANSGWTIQPVPNASSSEPVQAPPAGSTTGAFTIPGNAPSTAPAPTPIPTPVSSAR